MTSNSSTRVWTSEQNDIFDFFTTQHGHLVVRALAGTGKTTTIVEAVKRWLAANPGKTVVVCAFNKRIEQELVTRFVGFPVVVKTLHALGLSCVKRFWERVGVDFSGTRADALAQSVCGSTAPDAIKRLVSKLHTKGREILAHATRPEELRDLAVQFECEPDESWNGSGFDLEYVCTKAIAAMELAATVKPVAIDGSDMIFLPVRNHWLNPQYDRVVVDEMQDMTTVQLEIAMGILKPGGQFVGVGDNNQAIYAFRGADSQSLDRIKVELNASELGLTCTYRCGRAIVELAKGFVPNFRAADSNPDGEILCTTKAKLTAEAQPGDFILSRANAPLIPVAMALLRSGKRAQVAGRDIGAGLIGLIRKLAKGEAANSMPKFLARVETWRERESERVRAMLTAKGARAEVLESKLEFIADQASMLTELSDGARGVPEVQSRIEALFTDDGLGQKGIVTLSSVHKSKGLEADRVFILRDTLREHNQEERNIQYVAITRAIKTLVWVGEARTA